MHFPSIAALAVSAVLAQSMDSANSTSSTTTTVTTANSTTKKGYDDKKTKSDSYDGVLIKVYLGPSTAAPIPISTAAPSKSVINTPCSSPDPTTTATAAPAIVDSVVTSTQAPYLPLPTTTQTPSPYITVSPEAIDGVPMGYNDASSPVAQETAMPILSTGDIVSSSFAAGVCAAVAFLAL